MQETFLCRFMDCISETAVERTITRKTVIVVLRGDVQTDHLLLIEMQTGLLGFVDHPNQSLMSEWPGLTVILAPPAPDIAMVAGELDLKNVLCATQIAETPAEVLWLL
jgi:hypothetical protein